MRTGGRSLASRTERAASRPLLPATTQENRSHSRWFVTAAGLRPTRPDATRVCSAAAAGTGKSRAHGLRAGGVRVHEDTHEDTHHGMLSAASHFMPPTHDAGVTWSAAVTENRLISSFVLHLLLLVGTGCIIFTCFDVLAFRSPSSSSSCLSLDEFEFGLF